MRLSLFMLFVFAFQLVATNSEAQNAIINIESSTLSIGQLISEIESQTDYLVIYRNRDVDTRKEVEVPEKSGTIDSYLSAAFSNTDINYEFENKYILLSKKEVKTIAPVANAVVPQQGRRLTVVVTDNMGPVIGANVMVKGTTTGNITDLDGYSVIENAPSSGTLVISYIGYLTREVAINNQTTINVTLVEDTQALDEVVVVGYGVQKKSDITGAISSVKSSDLESRSVTSVVDALAGKSAGVSVVSVGGNPGEAGTMMIRGYSSNRSSAPLYVVDGLRVDNISNLDPNTIESLEILKDAASAAIYGAEAGNGVVMVTTKSGKSGTSRIEYEMQYMINSMTRTPKILDAQGYVDWLVNNGKYTQNDIDATIAAGLWDGRSSVDWMDEMTENGMSARHTLSFQGANDKGSYYASIGYTDQDGIVVGKYDTYERINATLNTSYKLRPWLEIGNTANFMSSSTNAVAGGGGLNSSFFGAVYYFDPTVSVTYSPDNLPTYMQNLLNNGSKLLTNSQGDYYGVSQLISTNPCNPWVTLLSQERENKVLSLQGNAYANITPQFINGLVFTTRLAYNIRENNTWNFTRHYYGGPGNYSNNASVTRANTNMNYYQWENFANYNVNIANDHDLGLMAGMSYSHQNNYTLSAAQSKIRSDVEDNPLFWDLEYASSDSDKTLSGTHRWQRKLSYYGRLNYSYKNTYTLQVSLRADAADLSILSKQNRWGYFPAVSTGWQMSNENWFPRNTPVDFLKLRASWGQNGSTASLNNYAYASTIATTGTGYSFNGSSYTVSSATSRLSNEALKWETSEQINIGLDTRFLSNRLSFSVDWFKKTTKGLILDSGVTVPAAAGNTAPVMNGGNVLNRGWEFEASWRDRINDFNYSISANFSTLHNEVTKIHETVTRYTANSLQSYGDLTAFEAGHPVWYLWTYHSEGIDSETGNPIIADMNNDGLIDTNDKIEAGSGLPKFQYGFTLNASYKNIELSVFGQGVGGNKIFRATGPYQQNTLQYFADRTWTPETKNTATMAPMNSANYGYYIVSDAFVYDASYFKIKQIQLGYRLPAEISRKLSISGIRVYVSLEDWFCFTPYKVGMDPSASANNSTGIGIDYGSYPNYKKTMFGINVSF